MENQVNCHMRLIWAQKDLSHDHHVVFCCPKKKKTDKMSTCSSNCIYFSGFFFVRYFGAKMLFVIQIDAFLAIYYMNFHFLLIITHRGG